MKDEEYKKMSLREFERAAAKFDDDPSVYNLCRKDYPDVWTEVVKEPSSDLLDADCGTGAMLELFKWDSCALIANQQKCDQHILKRIKLAQSAVFSSNLTGFHQSKKPSATNL